MRPWKKFSSQRWLYSLSMYLWITAGPSFPVGDFGDNDFVSNGKAGLAKTGYAINLNYAYHINPVFAVAINGSYGHYGVDGISVGDGTRLSIDPWQYYGIMAGPMVTTKIAEKTYADFNLLSGAAFASFAKFSYNGTDLIKQDWSTTVPIKLAADIRLGFSKSSYFLVGVDYLYMNPKFTVSGVSEGESLRGSGKQKITMFGINAGVGFSF